MIATRRRVRPLLAALAASALTLSWGLVPAASATVHSPRATTHVVASSTYHFSSPVSEVALGGHLYVLNCFSCTGRSSGISAAGGSISVIDQVSGAEVAEWSPFGTDELPTSIATDGTHLWVVDAAGLLGGKSQLVELSTTGAVVRTLAWPGSKPTSLLALDGRLRVAQRGSTALTAIDPVSAQLLASVASTTRQPAPTALASDGTHLWVASAAGLSERDAHTGALLATVPSAKATLSAPVAMAYSATLLWVVSHSYGAGDSLCSVSVKTATITSCRNARVAALAHPVAIVADSSHLYVANFDRSTVVQYSLAGAVTKTLSAPRLDLSQPSALVDDGRSLFVLNEAEWNDNVGSITVFAARTGAFLLQLHN